MSKREIPIPERDDEFMDLEDELNKAMQTVEQHNKSTESALREFAESEEPVVEDENADAPTETSESGETSENEASETPSENIAPAAEDSTPDEPHETPDEQVAPAEQDSASEEDPPEQAE